MKERKMRPLLAVGMLAVTGLGASPAWADKATDEIAKYREMIADGNPSELVAAQGEDLWKKKRGPKNASLEQCDLGLGPGVIKGAYAQMPRYFKDTGKVQDLETRLMTCMQTLQGIEPKEVINAQWLKGERETMAALVAYVVTESNGAKIKVDLRHPEM
jgi:sulfur-oxidizing protein SoxA